MPFITVGLLRKRAEHNEGCLADLEEIALHQQELEGITVIGDMCRKLQILYLCNNYIPRIENLHHLKCLTYLNLAVNSIKVVEGLEHCEMLTKLDLTLNFISDLESVRSLRANPFLETLHLTGNPCTNTAGYRHYVIQSLPQLKILDGEAVKRSEMIGARQDSEDTRDTAHAEALKAREAERIKDEMRARGIDPFPAKYNEQGERVYGHSAEERLQMLRETQEEEEKKKQVPHDPNSISAIHAELNKKPVALTPEQEIEKYGHVLQKNEAKLPYSMEEDVVGTQDVVVVTVEPGRFISTTLINVDVQPTYVRVDVKGKVLQLHTPVEVALSGIKVVRSQTTGQLKITIPVAVHIATERAMKRRRATELTSIDD